MKNENVQPQQTPALQAGPGNGKKDKEPKTSEAEEVEREEDDDALVPDDDDFDKTYGDLEGGNESDILPGPDKGEEIL